MRARTYDAIIAGASFAGLAVARELHGRVLLLDRYPVGEHQTSACGTPLWIAEQLGVKESVLQVHRRAVVHTPTRTVIYDALELPYCTFDYRRFCHGLLVQSDAEFRRTTVRSLRDGVVETDAGRFEAPVIVDASGWHRALVGGPALATRRVRLSFGLETEAGYTGDDLYFWVDPTILEEGAAWLFPIGGRSRVGVGSYAGASKLRGPLERFLGGLDLVPGSFHGTYFPAGLAAPTVGRVFAVGDAGGHCLPLTGEGIRPAVYFGRMLGGIAQGVIDGRLSLESALATYRRRVLAHRSAYRLLRAIQWVVQKAPGAWLGSLAELSLRPWLFRRWWPAYLRFGRAGMLDERMGAAVFTIRSQPTGQ
ncbi:MAG: NAD(P)/FAD-dependent oxidoreductase [Candidatus Rokubacteria bacterium]|nr:NAD(P)/FAD-dependent oxidoreductase [Candidatus Rokubacteria bacterium]